jgi:hypothetical protein
MPDGILKLGSWCVLGLLQNGYLEIVHANWFLIFQTAQGPSEPNINLQIGFKKWLKKLLKTILMKKAKSILF